MSKGNKIIISAEPKGRFLEGTISGAKKPGTLMQMKTSAGLTNGRPTWEPLAPGSDGLPRLIAVLTEDELGGRDMLTAYVDGAHCFLYAPVAGEEVNVMAGEVAGTGNTYAFGDLLMAD